jgi:ATP-dependent RNA helicase DDX1
MAAFEELGTCPELIRAVSEMGWLLPTPVQAEAVGLILGGGDVAAAAETGSGKTGAFALPILQVCHEALQQRAVAAAAAATTAAAAGGAAAAAAADARTARAARLRGPLRVSTEDREAQLAVDGSGLVCQSRAERQWQGARTERGVRSGAHYYEATVCDEGLVRVGWSQLAAKLELGTDAFGYGYGGTAKKSNNRQFDSYGELYGKGDVIGCYLDLGAGEVAFSKNGKHLGKAFSLPARMKNGKGGGWFPALTMKNAEVALNFGDDPNTNPLRYPPAKQYAAVGAAAADVVVSAADDTDGDGGGGKGGGGGGSGKGDGPVALILEPARELAEQVCDEIAKFKKYLSAPNLSHGLFVGGVDVRDNVRTLSGGCHIVVGTPGRVLDLVESGKMRLHDVQFFVLDEADRLLDTGNQQSISKLHAKIKKHCAQAVLPDGFTGRPLQVRTQPSAA